jgi:hypothetical protein
LRAEQVGSKGNRVKVEVERVGSHFGGGRLEMYQAGLQPELVRDGVRFLRLRRPQCGKALPYRRMLEKGQRLRLGSRRSLDRRGRNGEASLIALVGGRAAMARVDINCSCEEFEGVARPRLFSVASTGLKDSKQS